ncbi:MAG: amino acid adenylation domain-containing protein [Ardenticatenales bacterium]|nr:amino acid adenylation domain-containing protein [Ardenticatenales bacterium]
MSSMPYPAAARPAAPVGPLLHDIFVAAARRHPDRTAVEVPPGPARPQRASITYADLAADAAAIAARLSPLVTPDARVVILLPRDTVTLYAAQLGTLLAGAAHVCLDPAFPDPHLAAVIADAAPVAILTDAAGASRLPDVAAVEGVEGVEVVEVAAIDRMTSIPSTSPSTSPSTTPTDLAYLTYTSGTTGRPKGVMIEHRSIVHLVASDVTAFALTPDDRVAQCSSPAYDSSIEETWLAFASGATLVVLDDAAVRLGPDLVDWLARERITVLCPPPTLLRMMACDDPATALPALRLLYVGGEALPQDLADTWSRGRRMVNGYGPTECTVTVVRADVMPGQPVTIGRAIDGSEAHVLAADGELCISGISLARGYLGQDALTDERFPIHPHMGRIYRTGDRVRRMADGTLAYLGRIDAQVKLRGHRIELEAIDTHLAALPGVRAAASCVQGDGPAAVLVAHIVPERSDAPPEAVALAAALGAILPDHMVPRRFGFLSDLPTSVGASWTAARCRRSKRGPVFAPPAQRVRATGPSAASPRRSPPRSTWPRTRIAPSTAGPSRSSIPTTTSSPPSAAPL